jgi:hypothetical protein
MTPEEHLLYELASSMGPAESRGWRPARAGAFQLRRWLAGRTLQKHSPSVVLGGKQVIDDPGKLVGSRGDRLRRTEPPLHLSIKLTEIVLSVIQTVCPSRSAIAALFFIFRVRV